eukprot:scaffold2409_cov121-Isochrysis_galbana.AAC.13
MKPWAADRHSHRGGAEEDSPSGSGPAPPPRSQASCSPRMTCRVSCRPDASRYASTSRCSSNAPAVEADRPGSRMLPRISATDSPVA